MSEYTPKHSSTPDGEKVKNPKITYYILISIAAALLIVSIIMLCIKFFGGRENYDDYKTSYVVSTILPTNPIDFDEIRKVNPDVCAWIQIPGIDVIDYPILQSAPEADDNFYLNHDIEGVEKLAGAIYIQKLNHNDFSDQNTLIYGHNMINGTMFGQLKKFRNKDFFNENRTIFIYTPDRILEYEIVSAFVYDNRHILNSFNFDIENECQEFFDTCINPTSFTKQVREDATLTTKDKIITLSTCTANDSERYLVVGKLVKTTLTLKKQ